MNAILEDKRHMLLGAAIVLQQIFGTRTAASYLADIDVSLGVALELLANSDSRENLSTYRDRQESVMLERTAARRSTNY
jgi:hypothetical protein